MKSIRIFFVSTFLLYAVMCQVAEPSFTIKTDTQRFRLSRVTGETRVQPPRREKVAHESMVKLIQWLEFLKNDDFSGIKTMISSEEGVFVDLKAHRSRNDFIKDLQNPDGYFQTYYLNTKLLRKHSRDSGQISIRDFIKQYDNWEVQAHVESVDRVEFRIIPENATKESYRLNQPVLIRESNGWKLLRLP